MTATMTLVGMGCQKLGSPANPTFPELRPRCSYRTCWRSPNRLCNRRPYIIYKGRTPALRRRPGDGRPRGSEVHLVFADSRRFAEEWSYRLLSTALADATGPNN